ncbi:MAG: cysteine--tRNA ligase [Candidatus Diapherotrites archaeon]|nr:cysteine--tRNA ligase [Candidatus Diapherotrites archaeon]
MLRLYNTLSRKIEEIAPSDGREFKIYNCGPTVYDYAHIGNLRTFTLQDLLNRYLRFHGFRVKLVMNVTDVDDKTIKRSAERGLPLNEFTSKYAQEFLKDLDALGILRPDKLVYATQEIPEMVKIISALIDKGFAYKATDGVYFDIKKSGDYGKLSKLKLKKLKSGVRLNVDSYEKNTASDFALWKAWQESDGSVFWSAPFGKGRPGWHIECSAMSLKHLGKVIDIHGGGVDLVFPHHENEIAQSESFTGSPVVRHWFHSNHLIVEGRKMSKSLGNYYTLRDLSGYSARALRLLFFSAHYRDELDFSLVSLANAEKTIKGFDEFVQKLSACKASGGTLEAGQLVKEAEEVFGGSLDDDLGTPKMLAGLHGFFRDANKLIDSGKVTLGGAKEILSFLERINSVLGVFRFDFSDKLSKEEEKLVSMREKARKEKDYKKSDELRQRLLKEHKIQLDDTAGGFRWKRI